MDLKLKIIVLLISFLIQFPLSGQQITDADYYIDGTGGNDSNDGLTSSTAWKTLDKLQTFLSTSSANNKIFAIRDSIEYRRASGSKNGNSLALSISSGVRITNWYGSDSDNYPRIIGSKSFTGSWTNYSGNVWTLTTSMTNQHSVWRNYTDSIKWFIERGSIGALTENERFYFDASTLYIYTTTDPNSGGIEVEWYKSGMYLNTNNNRIDHLQFVMNNGAGISITRNLSGNVIDYNILSYNGTTDLRNRGGGVHNSTGNIRISNNWIESNSSHGVQTYNQTNGEVLENIQIDSNYIYLNYHTGIDFNLQGGSIGRDNLVRYNTIYNPQYNPYGEVSKYGAGFFVNASGGSTNEVKISYNLIYGTVDSYNRPENGSYGAQIANDAVVTFENNTFHRNGSNIIIVQSGATITLTNNIFDNAYYSEYYGYEITLGLVHNNGGTLNQSNNIGYGNANDFTGTLSDPLFISKTELSENFRLQSISPAIDLGIPLGYTEDLDGNPIIGNPDAGAYEGTFGPDIIPPEVTGAVLQDSVTLYISFSEPLESISAQNPDNYSITGGISIISVSHSGSHVTLTTSAHSPGIYTVSVINVEDIAGNQIPSNNNTAEYEMLEDPYSQLEQLEIVNVTASVIPEPEHSPENTIDGLGSGGGDPDSRWAGDTMPEWLMFDLGVNRNVSLTKLSFFKWDEGRIYNYSIEASNDMNQWEEVVSNTLSSSTEWTTNELDPINARYIKVNFISSNQSGWASLWEVQIWGFITTSVEEEKSSPEGFKLEQNYPNPFNPSTTIQYVISQRSFIYLRVYDILGNEVVTLVNEEKPAGSYKVSFNGAQLTSGVYIYKLATNNFVDVKKMILMK